MGVHTSKGAIFSLAIFGPSETCNVSKYQQVSEGSCHKRKLIVGGIWWDHPNWSVFMHWAPLSHGVTSCADRTMPCTECCYEYPSCACVIHVAVWSYNSKYQIFQPTCSRGGEKSRRGQMLPLPWKKPWQGTSYTFYTIYTLFGLMCGV